MPELGEPLSDRELDVLRCLSSGAGNKEIAAELFISENTVKVHLRNIYTKLGVTTRTEASTVALQQGMIVMPGMETAVPAITPLPAPPENADAHPDASPAAFAAMEPSLVAEAAPPDRRRLIGSMVIAGLVIVTLMIIALINRQNSLAATPTPPPFEPVDLGENWETIRPLPAPRTGIATESVGLNVYVIAGQTDDGVTNSVLAYHAQDGIWEEVAAKPTAVTDTSAAELFGEIFVPGGQLADGQPTDVLEVYSPTNNAWRVAQSLPHPIAGGLALSDGSFLYLIGGWDGEKVLDTVYRYDPAQDGWQPLPPMSQARAHLIGGALLGHLYAVGGDDGERALATCEFYSPPTDEWLSCPEMLLPRTGAGAATILNKLYVVGGQQTDGETAAFSELFDPSRQEWTILNTPVLADTAVWTSLGATNVETRLYMLGGKQDGNLTANAYQYSPLVYQTFIPAASGGER